MNVADTALGPYNNFFVVFGYQDANNYFFAGCWIGARKWVIGQNVNGTWSWPTAASFVDSSVTTGISGPMEVRVNGNTVTLTFNGVQKVSYTFPSVPEGELGLATSQAHSHFDNVCIQAVP